jgi:ABC-type glycerol-3-phosphate transport system substrate-binding protein
MVYVRANWSGSGRFDPATGKLLASYLGGTSAATLNGDEYVQLMTPEAAERAGQSIDANSLFFSDAKTGEVNRIVSAEKLSLKTGAKMAPGPDGEIYITDSSGLYSIAPGSDNLELLLDGAWCSLSIPSASASCVLPHGEKELFINFSNGQDGALLSNFVYSADTPALPDTELTVFSMRHNKTVSQAMGVFRKKYPNTLVRIRTSDELTDAGNGDGDDARRTLNTEILAGNGPDIFVMDDLPTLDYIEKGVLADLSNVIKPLVDNNSILPAVAKAFERDGGIYAIPARVSLPTLWGGEEAIAAANDLDSLLAYAKLNPDKRLFGDMRPEALLHTFMPGQWQSQINESGVDAAAVEKLLTTILELSQTVENPHIYSYFGSEEHLSQIPSKEFDWNRQGDPAAPENHYAVSNNRAELMPQELDGFMSVMLPNGVINKRIGGMTWDTTGNGDWNSELPDEIVENIFRPYPDGGWYEPGCVLAVNAASEQQELSMAFVETVLSEETQNADLAEGFPVNRADIAKNAVREESWYASGSFSVLTDDPELAISLEELAAELRLEYAWPSKAMMQAVANRLDGIVRPIMDGYPLNIEYGMKENLPLALDKVVSGEMTAREAAGWLADELSLAIEE